MLKKASVLDPGLMKINQSMQSKALMNIAYGRNKECSSTGSLNSYLSPIVSNDLKCLNDSSELLVISEDDQDIFISSDEFKIILRIYWRTEN